MKREAEEWGGILSERLKFFGAVFLCLLIDCVFLIAWLALHWALSKGQAWFAPVGPETFTTIFLRVLLEVPTFVLIIIFIVADAKRITLRIFKGAARDLSKGGKSNANNAIDLGN